MHRASLLLAATALMSLAACSDDKTEATKANRETKLSIAIASDDDKAGDSDSGKFELKLPGGLETRVNLPDGIGDHGKFDIDGVGMFPGAKVRSVNVNASSKGDSKSAIVKIGFNAPADAAAVADWYQQQFDAKNIKVTRSGETLSGTSEDGDAFTIALEGAGTGASKGVVTITDSKDA